VGLVFLPTHAGHHSVDLTIAGPDGKPLPMGTGFDAFDPFARTRALEEQMEKGGKLSSDEKKWLQNRRMLYHVMSAAGFTNYWKEWWHFDYGNQFWAAITQSRARYSSIDNVKHW
jgi:D-alanyl-D-alanine dipeptidase